MGSLPAILFCQCRFARVLPPDVTAAALDALSQSKRAVTVVEDLCGAAARRDPLLKDLAGTGAVKIAACYPRAVRWLFTAAGASLDPARVEVVNLRVESVDSAIAKLLDPNLAEPAEGEHAPARISGVPADKTVLPAADWYPWFPVVDFDRCTNCMQCLGFCLFGVFGVDNQQRLTVQAPANCKPNCPACSRVCPQAAIMFPKYATSPINGDLVKEADLQREQMKADVSALLGGDVYSLLRSRNDRAKARFSKERDPAQALAERQRCLALVVGQLPPEVLKNLPSPEELRRRAIEAKARAEAARQAGSEPGVFQAGDPKGVR